MEPWWVVEVRAMQRWTDRHNRETWGSGMTLRLVAVEGNGWRAPVSSLVWEDAQSAAFQLIGARGTAHIPIVYNTGRGYTLRRTLAPQVLLQAVGGIQPPSLVGDILLLSRVDAERLATLGRLGGDHARLAYLKDVYRRELRGNDRA